MQWTHVYHRPCLWNTGRTDQLKVCPKHVGVAASRTGITGLFFLCTAFCVVANAVACSSHLKCVHVWNWIRKCCVYWVCFLRSVFVWQQHSNNSAVCCFENNCWFLVSNLHACFGLYGNSMLLTRKLFLNKLYMTFSNTKFSTKQKKVRI